MNFNHVGGEGEGGGERRKEARGKGGRKEGELPLQSSKCVHVGAVVNFNHVIISSLS